MCKKLIVLFCSVVITLTSLCYVDFICAEDADFSGYCGKPIEQLAENNPPLYDDPLGLPYTHEEYVEYFKNEELELLAHLIFAEAGSDWCSDKMQQYTGSVVLNRIASPYFPNNMYDVIYQKGQYSVTRTGAINRTPNERAYNVARFLLENGSVLPANVVFQSQHIQGDGIYEKVQNMYFCYKN